MTTESELSGVDLARQALLAAREAAKKNGSTRQKPKRRTATVVRREGREPLGLGSAISRMMTERGMAAPAVGGRSKENCPWRPPKLELRRGSVPSSPSHSSWTSPVVLLTSSRSRCFLLRPLTWALS
ncbi:hypothetical protein ACFXAY_26410 [Streptomyces microflavus]|uniref:hypothetical protein n=1 Tax=Streptomyces microflavus TaxID=1919 RepID=UPI0036A1B910